LRVGNVFGPRRRGWGLGGMVTAAGWVFSLACVLRVGIYGRSAELAGCDSCALILLTDRLGAVQNCKKECITYGLSQVNCHE
jgi:hypothetical protein